MCWEVEADVGLPGLTPIIMAGILAIYGLVMSIQVATSITTEPMALSVSFIHLGAGLATGLSALAAGFSIGIVGDAGVRAVAQQPRLFVGMVLILIFAEVLGLYGLIVGLLLLGNSRGAEDMCRI